MTWCGELESKATRIWTECLDAQGAARCGLPAEVEHRYSMRSSDGPLDSAKIRCPRGHWFNGPLESLIWASPQPRARPAHAGRLASRSDAR